MPGLRTNVGFPGSVRNYIVASQFLYHDVSLFSLTSFCVSQKKVEASHTTRVGPRGFWSHLSRVPHHAITHEVCSINNKLRCILARTTEVKKPAAAPGETTDEKVRGARESVLQRNVTERWKRYIEKDRAKREIVVPCSLFIFLQFFLYHSL